MSRVRKRRRYTIPAQFAWRLIEMLESPAYRVLSQSGHRVVSRVEMELGSHGGFENGALPVTFDNFEAYGIHRHSIAPAIREAVALGFLEVVEVGYAGVDVRVASKYRLTYRPTDKADPTDDWRKIQTLEDAESIAKAAREAKSERAVELGRRAHERRKSKVPVVENAKISAGIRH